MVVSIRNTSEKTRPHGALPEAPHTLTEQAPRALGFFDQLGFWGNLGVSLLGFGGAVAVAAPAGFDPLPLGAAFLAIVVGTVLGASKTAPTRPAMLVAWAAGFVVYQLLNPGTFGGWSSFWADLGMRAHLAGHPWLSASVTSFVVAFALAWPLARRTHPLERSRDTEGVLS